MSRRAEVRADIAARIARLGSGSPRLVAVDGVDGAGKTVVADELAVAVRSLGRPVVRVSIDGFHRPGAERYARGRSAPDGFFLDSYDYGRFCADVVAPVRPGGSRRIRTAAFDHVRDRAVEPPTITVPEDAIVLVDGIFLHRDELHGLWDWSIFVRAPFATTFARMAARDGCPPDPEHPANHRYLQGQRIYLAACEPERRADVVVDNEDPATPRIVSDAV